MALLLALTNYSTQDALVLDIKTLHLQFVDKLWSVLLLEQMRALYTQSVKLSL